MILLFLVCIVFLGWCYKIVEISEDESDVLFVE